MPSIASTSGPAGYSPSPQRRKLALRPGMTYLLWNDPHDWDFAEPMTDGARISLPEVEGMVDFVLAFVTELDHLAPIATDLSPLIYPDGSLWIAWPRKAAGHRSDVTEQLLRDRLLPLGVVDTKVAAIDRDWSGLKFVWRKDLRTHSSASQASASYRGNEGC